MSEEAPQDGGRRWPSRRVADELRAEIDQGKYAPGDQLPSYRELAATKDIAVNTAREAVRLLEQEGRVEVRHGSGAYVRDEHGGSADEQLREARAALADARSRLKDIAVAVADAEARVSQAMSRIQPGAG